MNKALRTVFGRVAAGGKMPWKSILFLSVLLTGVFVSGAIAQEDVAPVDPVPAPAIDAVFGAGLDRENRALTGLAEEFVSDVGQVYCLTRIRGLEAPTTVTHAWYHEGQAMARVELKVGSADWRTWSSKLILPAWTGSWEVKVLDASGKVMATSGFTVK